MRLLAIVGNYLQQAAREGTDTFPLYLERKLDVAFPGVPHLRVIGKIDRIDQVQQKLRVIDYKSGSDPWKNDNRKSQRQRLEVLLGYRMQPHLYPWLTRQAEIGDEAQVGEETEFQFLFLGENPPAGRVIRTEVAADKLLRNLTGIIEKGYYFPTSSEAVRRYLDQEQLSPCDWCDFISLCRRFDGSAPYHAFNLLRRRVSDRFKIVNRYLDADEYDDKSSV